MENDTVPLYPGIRVRLVGEDGNAFFIISRVRKALQRGGVSTEDIKTFTAEAMSGDYANVIGVVTQWVHVK